MHRKCYPIIAARNPINANKNSLSGEIWSVFGRTSERMIIMSRYTHDVVTYAPFYIYSFRLVAPHKPVDAEKFNIRCTASSRIDNTPDRLRWYRYQKGLLPADVAAYAGIDQATYSRYEEGAHEYYPIEIMDKAAELFGVPVTALLDEYNLFLYYGQRKQIQFMRELRRMSISEYAQQLGIYSSNLRRWENDEIRIKKRSWKLLRDKG